MLQASDQSHILSGIDNSSLTELTLAKDASERAAKLIERTRVVVEDLDRESQSLLASVPSQVDRALIANPTSRSDLRSVAQKITCGCNYKPVAGSRSEFNKKWHINSHSAIKRTSQYRMQDKNAYLAFIYVSHDSSSSRQVFSIVYEYVSRSPGQFCVSK